MSLCIFVTVSEQLGFLFLMVSRNYLFNHADLIEVGNLLFEGDLGDCGLKFQTVQSNKHNTKTRQQCLAQAKPYNGGGGPVDLLLAYKRGFNFCDAITM